MEWRHAVHGLLATSMTSVPDGDSNSDIVTNQSRQILMRHKERWVLSAVLATTMRLASAADHAEALVVAADQGADMPDVYAFLDPNDNSKAILALDVHGFIVPGENGNFSAFDSEVLFRFEIENTGDAKPDRFINIIFDRQTSRSTAQIAHVSMTTGGRSSLLRFDAPTTVASPTASLAAAPATTTDSDSGVSFFAGLREDPFFFDIPAFNRFVGSVTAGSPDASHLKRGRDTFAGYNVQMITLSVPVKLLRGSKSSVIGVSGTTLRTRFTQLTEGKAIDGNSRAIAFSRPFLQQIDRMGNPVINTVVIPFPRKDEYNRANTEDDADGKFAGDIVKSLKGLGTSDANIGVLASVAVTRGDFLRLDTSIANRGAQGGVNAGAGFPNGRRPSDDVIDTVVTIVTNGGITTGDNVNSNDAVFLDAFPFFAAPNQPRVTGIIDDNTRN
jgi:hypothetical protein